MMSETSGVSSAGSLIGGAGWALVMLGIAWSPELAAQEQELPVIGLPPAEAVFPNKRFSWIRSVRELSDGRLLVSDRIERALYVVDFQSGGIRTIGTVGEGPGEYQWPGFLYALAGDSTLFTDESRHKWFLMVGDSRLGADPPLDRERRQFARGDRSGPVRYHRRTREVLQTFQGHPVHGVPAGSVSREVAETHTCVGICRR